MRRLLIANAVAMLLAAGCSDDGTSSTPSCQLAAGDLVISEIMYDPPTGGMEWFEIYNATNTVQNLRLLKLKAGNKTIRDETIRKELKIKAKSYFLVAIGKVSGDGGPSLDADFVWDNSSALTNTGATITLTCGSVEVTKVNYTPGSSGWAKASKGKALQLSARLLAGTSRPDAAEVVKGSNWCEATSKIEDKHYGTPGKANVDCPLPPQCGHKAGDLLITEIMADPKAPDSNSEYFEIYNNKGTKISTVGGLCLKIWTSNALTGKANYAGSITKALPLDKGGFLTIGSGEMGKDRPWVDYYWSKMSLTNSGATVGLYCDDKCDKSEFNASATLIHKVAYGNKASGKGPPKPSSGVAKELSGSLFKGARIPTAETEKPGNWCDATATYDAKSGDKGTPGKANSSCSAVSCSHPVRDGDLVINEYMVNGAGNESNQKEWVEVKVVKAAKDNKVDLSGLEFVYGKDLAAGIKSSKLVGTGCMTHSVGERILLGRKPSGSVDCSVSPKYTFGGSALGNSAGAVGLRLINGQKIIAKAEYTSSKDGVAQNRDESSGKYCAATTQFCADKTKGAVGLGTPGKANVSCP